MFSFFANIADVRAKIMFAENESAIFLQVNSSKGLVDLPADKSVDSTHHVSDSKSSLWNKNVRKTDTDETTHMAEFETKGGVELTGAKGVKIEIKDSKTTPFSVLASDPKTAYVADYLNKAGVTVTESDETHEHIKKKTESIGPAAAILVSVVVAACTWGAGLYGTIATAAGGGMQGAFVASVATAGINSAGSKVLNSGISNKGNLKKIKKDVISKKTFKTVATAMATAAVTFGVTEISGVKGMEDGFAKTVAENAVKSTASAAASVIFEGADLNVHDLFAIFYTAHSLTLNIKGNV